MDYKENQFAMNFTPFQSQRVITFYSAIRIPNSFYPSKLQIVRFMLWRRQKNMNTILLICGAVRTGKSYDGLKIAEEYCLASGNEFNVRDQCSFEILPFLKWSKNATDDIYILDEVGNTLNAQDWFKIQSKIMRNFIFAQGFRRNVLIVILPNTITFLKSLRAMVNYIIETKEQGYAKWYKQQVRYITGKIMKPYYMGSIRFSLPSPKVVKEYEDMKKEWNDNQLEQDIEQMESMKETRYYTMPKKDLNLALKKGLIGKEKYINDITSKGYKKEDAELMGKIALMENKSLYNHECSSCGHEWASRSSNPLQCPSCRTRKWNE